MSIITDKNERQFQGWITVEIRDDDGELIPLDTLDAQMETFLDRGAPLMLNHSGWQIGRMLDYERKMNDDAGAEGYSGRFQVFRNYPIDDDAWDAIQTGALNQLSMAGQFEMNEDKTSEWSAPMEISVTGEAVGSKAVNEACDITNVSKSKVFKRIMGKGDTMSGIDEKVNKKSAIDEKLNKEKADAEAGTVEKKELPAEGEKPAVEVKDGEGNVSLENLNERLTRIEQMLDKLLAEETEEGTTDHAIEKAEQPPGTGASPAPEVPTIHEQVAKFSKELGNFGEKMIRIEAKFAKLESTGHKRTVQSGTANESEEVAFVKGVLG